MDKKVTSYRLSVDTLQKLDELVDLYNQEQLDKANELGFKVAKKITKADLLETFVNAVYENRFNS